MQKLVRLFGCCLVLGLTAARCFADGGVVRAIEQDGPLAIAVFTSPNPLVAGTVDVSVLVQDAATRTPLDDALIEVTITPRNRTYAAVSRAATSRAATNKLFRACLVDLEAGHYDVEVRCRAAAHRGEVSFPLEVGAAPTPRAALWPWFTWPAVPIVLFGLHVALSGKRPAKLPAVGGMRLGSTVREA